MHIFIMRHGEASFHAFTDKDRPLTARGEEQADEQGTWLKSQTIPDLILVSPYLRAQQTCQLASQYFSKKIPTETWDNLTPYGNAEITVDYIDTLQQQGIDNLLIVSHLPLVDDIVTALGVNDAIAFHPATIAKIEYQNGKGELLEVHKSSC